MSEPVVRAALEAAGFPASEEEIAVLVATYPAVRGMVALLGPLVNGSAELSALHFDPDPGR